MLIMKPRRPGIDQELVQAVRTVRRRWRMKIVLRGLTFAFGTSLAVLLLSTFVMDAMMFDATAVLLIRIATYVAILGLGFRFLVRPLMRRVSDQQVALYLEEHEPSLQASLVSAVDVSQSGGRPAGLAGLSPELTRRLVEQAVERCRTVEFGRRVESKSVYQSSGTLAGIALVSALLLFLNPAFLRHGAPFLLFPWNSAEEANPYSISVLPGDTLLARGADQLVTTRLNGFDADLVEIVVRRGDLGEWERWAMSPGEEPGGFEIFLFDLDDAADYYVESSGIRSPFFRLDVADLPFVRTIDLEYFFPAYSGLSPMTVEDGGDIAALRGTRVVLRIRPTITVPSGNIIVDGGDPIPLEQASDGSWSGVITVRTRGYYRIELEGVSGRMVTGSPDYTIDALTDQPPSVRIAKPGHDSRVTTVEEPFVEVKAEDDYGIGRLALLYSVNGGAEDTLVLFGGGRQTKELSAGHTFYLEEMDLEPGDLVAYYARVWDGRGSAHQEAATDIYFMEVRPFRRDYRQADQGGGGGGGGEAAFDASLTQQQREIVSATFKVVRDGDKYEEDDYNENLAILALAQGRIRDRVEAIARRLGERSIVQMDSSFRKIAEELPQAAEAMLKAEEKLGSREPDEALPEAQKALQHLQRADAAFRDVQVAQNQQGGGGGGGGANAEDLADLFELELDKLRNQYESVQRGQQESVDNEIDATLQRLRELARRQQQENERLRQRAAQQQQQGQAGGGGRNQRALAEEAEELARRLERLSREQSLPELEETARSLQEAADAMRRAASGNNTSRGLAEGLSAMDELRDARRLLEDNQSARLSRDVDDALRRADRLAAQQRGVEEDVENLAAGGEQRMEQLQQLVERKDQMAEEVRDLEAQLDQMSRESRRDQPQAAQGLEDAANSIRENRLPEKIRYSRGVVQGRSRDYAMNFEDQIGSNIDELRDRIRDAAGSIGESDDRRLARSLDRTRDLVRGFESLQNRIEERADANAEQQGQQQGQEGQAGQQQGQEGQRGQEGQQGQGQPGQQGQGGQPGQGQGGSQSGGGGGFGPAGGGGPISGRLDGGDIRQFAREFQERRGDVEDLRRELSEQGIGVESLDEVLRRVQELERQRTYSDPDELRRLQLAVIEGLKEFEYSLRRELQGEGEDRLLLSGSDDVPAGFRELVEEYYRELSNRNR